MSKLKGRLVKKVTWGDLDALGIVFYPKFYEWMDEASHIFFDSIGLNLMKLLDEEKIIFALIETRARYIKPARYQDKIEIISSIKEIKEKTIVIQHEIKSLKNNSMLVEGYEKRICVRIISTGILKAVSFPQEIKQILISTFLEQPQTP